MLWSNVDRFNFSDPWRMLDRLDRGAAGYPSPSTSEFPLVNVWTNGEGVMVTSELPGLDAKEVDISVAGKSMILRGTRKTEDLCKEECRHRQERWSGTFSRSIELPFLIDQDKVEARFNKGVLQLMLHRAEAETPKKIEIKTE
jgi:HSP20 family protein